MKSLYRESIVDCVFCIMICIGYKFHHVFEKFLKNDLMSELVTSLPPFYWVGLDVICLVLL